MGGRHTWSVTNIPECQLSIWGNLIFSPPPGRACGARIVSRTDELREEDVGTGARLFEVKKIGDEYFTFITDCKEPKACTILLRGASKEILAVSDFHPLFLTFFFGI